MMSKTTLPIFGDKLRKSKKVVQGLHEAFEVTQR